MKPSPDRVAAALEVERLTRAKRVEEINRQSRIQEATVVRESAPRHGGLSGKFGGRLVELQRSRARLIVDAMLALRGETLARTSEVGVAFHFEALRKDLHSTIEEVFGSIPEHLRRHGFPAARSAAENRKFESDIIGLKAHVDQEIEILQREQALAKMEGTSMVQGKSDRKKVWVVHGRNAAARMAMFTFLRAIGLDPMEWGEALELTGKGSPYTGEVLDRAFEQAHAVVVLITGDDMARLGNRFIEPRDGPDERELSPQARPNVIFEAGMAFGKHPDRTILVLLGETRPFSNVVGRNVVYISNDPRNRQVLADRLRTAGCDVRTENRTDWHSAGDFDSANKPADHPSLPPDSRS